MILKTKQFKKKMDARRELERIAYRYFSNDKYRVRTSYINREYTLEIIHNTKNSVLTTYPVKVLKTRAFCMKRYSFEMAVF